MDNTLQQIKDLFFQKDRFAVLSHIRPDGDAYGTSLALALALKGLGKQVVVYNQDGLNPGYAYLPGSELIQATPATWPDEKSTVIAVDTSTYERLGENFTRTQLVPDLNLDHHGSNTKFGKINWIIGDSPASAEVLFEVFQELQIPINVEIATNLYVGLMTDTGSFRYRGTTARTLHIAAALVAAGADPSYLADQSYRQSSYSRFVLMREVLNATQFNDQRTVAWYHLDKGIFARTGADPLEVENFLDILLSVATIEVVFMVQELDNGSTRVSLRSRSRIDVSSLAAQFGGGGHKLAAGIRSDLSMTQLEEQLLQKINALLNS